MDLAEKRIWRSWLVSGVVQADTRRYWSIEVVRSRRPHRGGDPDDTWILLFSLSNRDDDQRLQCVFGYSNSAIVCDQLTGRGFPSLEAEIKLSGSKLTVKSASFPQREGQDEGGEMDYRGVVLELHGFGLRGAGAQYRRALERNYTQLLQTPDLVQPADFVQMQPVDWSFPRTRIIEQDASKVTVAVSRLRWPPTGAFAEELKVEKVWTSRLDLARTWGRADVARDPVKASSRAERGAQFGPPQFRFSGVEVLGFRIEIGANEDNAEQVVKDYYSLIEPLNFHLANSTRQASRKDYATPDFHYRPAAKALNIELLRYGRMTPRQAVGGMNPNDYQGQHELLVRAVVGRIDEDCAQAQQASTFVPAIFVDNPWSKFLGRIFLGMEKKLAHFCVLDGKDLTALAPNGRRADDDGKDPPDVEPLSRVAQVRLADKTGAAGKDLSKAPLLFSVACDPDLMTSWDDFQLVPTAAVLSDSPLAARRWRQEDFEDGDVRREFAREAGVGSTGAFHATQSVPIGERGVHEVWREETTWIAGRYQVVGSAMLARPRGNITITLHRHPKAPEGWKRLCNLLQVPDEPFGEKSITLPGGAWYRLIHDMDMTLENGLE